MSSINFSYKWYHTAGYSLTFPVKPMYQHKVSEVAILSLTFDDFDGASTDNEMFKCTRIQ